MPEFRISDLSKLVLISARKENPVQVSDHPGRVKVDTVLHFHAVIESVSKLLLATAGQITNVMKNRNHIWISRKLVPVPWK